MTLDTKIEGLLFFKGEPVSQKELAKFLDVSVEEVTQALKNLEEKLSDRGLQILYKGDEVTLGTHAELGPLLEKIRKEELDKELSKASLETLSVVMYKEGVTRSEIDYIRGVNSSFILRNLLIRGLIEKVVHPLDSRKYAYKPTFELLSYMGVSKIEDLPDYEVTRDALEKSFSGEESE